MTQETYLQQGKQKWRQLSADPRVRRGIQYLAYGLTGMLLSAVSLGKQPQPVSLGLICTLTGWRAPAAALGSILGYRSIWGEAGEQGIVWSLGGCLAGFMLGKKQAGEKPWLLPMAASLTVSVTGLLFQMLLEIQMPVGLYWLRTAVGLLATRLFQRLGEFWELGEPVIPKKGAVAAAQVRLEIASGVLSQAQQLLLTAPPEAVDEEALLARTRERACGGCPNRKGCGETALLTRELLHRSLTDTGSLHLACKKPNRLLLELRRSQEQLRLLRSSQNKRQECRQAVIQQYRFLSAYLRQTADGLTAGGDRLQLRFKAEAQIATAGKEPANGDRCQAFHGTGGKYYVLLCDGMGTGMGAAQEGDSALKMLRQMLTAGFPAEYALQSINSLCCLRGRAGAATVDLAEVYLDTGKAVVYKWGAVPSVLLRGTNAEKIGTAGPPPGLEITKVRETVDRLSLRRGETLILMSDGVDGEAVMRCGWIGPGEPLGEYAANLLAVCRSDTGDDATVAVIRLHPTSLYT